MTKRILVYPEDDITLDKMLEVLEQIDQEERDAKAKSKTKDSSKKKPPKKNGK